MPTAWTAVPTARVTVTPAAYERPGAATPAPTVKPVGRAQPHGDDAPTHAAGPARGHAPHVTGTRQLAGAAAAAAAVPATASPHTPTCAVPRLDPTRQVMQPSVAQLNWAAQMAEQGLLRSANGLGLAVVAAADGGLIGIALLIASNAVGALATAGYVLLAIGVVLALLCLRRSQQRSRAQPEN